MVCGVLNASYARLVAIVDQSLQDDSWAIAGVRSPEHWLAMRAGLSPFHARQVLAVVRRCGDLPTVMGQFAAGQLSLDQVSVVARYAPAHVEASVAEFAVNASVTQLRRALSKYSFDPPAQPGVSPRTTTFDTKDPAIPRLATVRPVTRKPATREPVTRKPMTLKPVTRKPATQEPPTVKPVTVKPATVKPAAPRPVTRPRGTASP